MKNTNIWSTVGILFAIIIVINMIVSNIQGRFDLTNNDVYTMSNVTKNTLDQIEDPILVKIFYSENFPKQLISVKQYVFDLLDEYKAYAGSSLDYEFVEIGEASDAKADAQAMGVQPVQANIIENDQQKVQLVYFGIAFVSGDKREIIPFANNVSQLEYDFTRALKKLTEGGKPKIAYFTGNDELSIQPKSPYSFNKNNESPVETENLQAKLNESYDIQTVDLNTVSEIPADISVGVWVDPKGTISEQARFLVDQFIMRGGRVAIFANNQKIDFQSPIPILPQQSNLAEILAAYGVRLNNDIVVDKQAGQVQTMQTVGNFRLPVQIEYPFLPMITTFDKEQSVVSRLSQMSLSFPSSVDSIAGSGLNFKALLQTSEQSGIAQKDPQRNIYSPDPKQFFNFNQKHIPLAATVSGKFKSPFSSKPDTVNYSGAFLNEANTDNGKLIVVGDADFIKDNMASPDNMSFFLNTVDWLIDENGLISIRSKNIDVKMLNKDILSEDAIGTRSLLKFLNVFLAPIILIVFGLLRYFIKRKTKQFAAMS